MKRPLALFLALLMALSLCACGGDTPLPTKEEMLENAETVYTNDLADDFRNNVIAAKDKYVGKPFIIPGIIVEIREDSCMLRYYKSSPVTGYVVKANIPVDELKGLNTGDLVRVVGIITDGIETEEMSIQGNTFTRNYITMENAYFVDKITEVSGTVHVTSGPEIIHYIEAPFLTGESDRIKLVPEWSYSMMGFYETVTEGAKITIPASDISVDSFSITKGYEIICTSSNIKVEKAG